MSIKEFQNYISPKLPTSPWYESLYEITKDPIMEKKLKSLYWSDWQINNSDTEFIGSNPNAGILYFNLVYKIVKKLESEGKL